MKRIKKIASLVLAMVMVLAMAIPVSAHNITITDVITDDEGSKKVHDYEAYQIFTGELDQNGKLFNVAWGSGVKSAGTFKFGKDATTGKEIEYDLTEKDDAARLAEALSNVGDESDVAKEFAQAIASVLSETKVSASSSDGEATITGLVDGYYFVKEAADSLEGDNAVYTRYILRVVGGDVDVTAKSDVPSVTKKVQDKNDTDNVTEEERDTADYDIGDEVSFTLTGTMPSNIDDYETYTYIFHDTLSTGLTYNNNAKVFIGTTEVTGKFDITETNGALTIGCDNLKNIGVEITADSVVTVEYTAVLNNNAVIGNKGNTNTVNLEFSNNPNSGGSGSTGTTPDDTVVVFTFKVVINKVNENNRPLEGAGFTLSKKDKDGNYQPIVGMSNIMVKKDGEKFTLDFKGIDDGVYKLEETTVPDGYNKMEDQYFKVVATHSDDPETLKVTKLEVNYLDKDGNAIQDSAITFTPNEDEGSLTTNVVNRFGSLLPSTGGIGTTIFYVVGGILVIGAGILLVTKRRMKAQ